MLGQAAEASHLCCSREVIGEEATCTATASPRCTHVNVYPSQHTPQNSHNMRGVGAVQRGLLLQKQLLVKACNRHSMLHTPPFSLSKVPVKPHSSPGRGPRLHSSTISRSPAHHSRAPTVFFWVEPSSLGMQLPACCPPALAPALANKACVASIQA